MALCSLLVILGVLFLIKLNKHNINDFRLDFNRFRSYWYTFLTRSSHILPCLEQSPRASNLNSTRTATCIFICICCSEVDHERNRVGINKMIETMINDVSLFLFYDGNTWKKKWEKTKSNDFSYLYLILFSLLWQFLCTPICLPLH